MRPKTYSRGYNLHEPSWIHFLSQYHVPAIGIETGMLKSKIIAIDIPALFSSNIVYASGHGAIIALKSYIRTWTTTIATAEFKMAGGNREVE